MNDWTSVTFLGGWPVLDTSDLDWVHLYMYFQENEAEVSTVGCSKVHFSTLSKMVLMEVFRTHTMIL